jgi:hypothetical protein
MSDRLDDAGWPVERLDEALQALATELGFSVAKHENKEFPPTRGPKSQII